MDDRELLELAAKAAGYKIEWVRNSGCHYRCEEEIGREQWCPLDDDGDALRLAVKLDISLRLDGDELTGIAHWRRNGRTYRVVGNYPTGDATAARLLIVRAAAEIGRAMP